MCRLERLKEQVSAENTAAILLEFPPELRSIFPACWPTSRQFTVIEWEASGNCLGERNECSVSWKFKLRGERRNDEEKKRKIWGETRTESIVRVERIKLPPFVGQKQFPNLIHYHAFKLPSLDFLSARNSLPLFLSLEKKHFFRSTWTRKTFKNGTFKNESDQDCGETWRVAFFPEQASVPRWEIIEKPGENLHEFPEKFDGRSTVRLNRLHCLETFLRTPSDEVRVYHVDHVAYCSPVAAPFVMLNHNWRPGCQDQRVKSEALMKDCVSTVLEPINIRSVPTSACLT